MIYGLQRTPMKTTLLEEKWYLGYREGEPYLPDVWIADHHSYFQAVSELDHD